jgi:hypothetical protein
MRDTRVRKCEATVEVERKALKITPMRVVAAARKALSERKPDPAPSLLKVKGSEIPQSISALMVGATGPYGITAPRGEALRARMSPRSCLTGR